MQRYQTEDEHRKAMRAKINKTIKRGRRRKRIIRRLKKAVELITVEHWDESQGALYFEKASDESTWHSRNLQKLFTHGAHAFYTEKE